VLKHQIHNWHVNSCKQNCP